MVKCSQKEQKPADIARHVSFPWADFRFQAFTASSLDEAGDMDFSCSRFDPLEIPQLVSTLS
jgi:hypothetical protein